jgi:hypothetical protein
MGHFGAAYMFVREPTWDRLGSLPADIALRGYEHPPSGLWFLDVWTPPAASHPFAFADAGESTQLMSLPADETIRTFDRIIEVIGRECDMPVAYGDGWLRLSHAVGIAMGQSAFFFAADDEWYDMACHIDAGGITGVACRMAEMGIRYADGSWVITPRIYGDGEEQWAEPMLALLRTLQGVRVDPPEARESESYLEHANSEWPAEAGDPAKAIGNWDWAMDLARQSRLVFERVSSHR